MGISCIPWNNSVLYLVSTQYLVVCFLISTISWILIRSCINCYISPLHPSAHTAAYSAHNPCRRRETRYLAFYGLPVKSHRPKPSRAILSVLQYLVLYTIHQPQYIVVSNWAMNMCILHKYLNYNILCYKATIPTIYSRTTRSARFAVSRAVYTLCGKLTTTTTNCEITQISRRSAQLVIMCAQRVQSAQRIVHFAIVRLFS